MSFLDNNREAKLKIKACKLAEGWSDIDIEMGKKKYHIDASYIGDSLATLVDRLYYLYPELGRDEYDFEKSSTIETLSAKSYENMN